MILKTNPILMIIPLLMMFLSTSLLSQTENTNEKDFTYIKLTGTISNYPIVMDLLKEGAELYGSYYYVKSGLPLYLNGEIDDKGVFSITERNEKGETTGTFSGQLSKGMVFTGDWINYKTDKSLPFKLEKSSDNSLSISFNYSMSENCDSVVEEKEINEEDDIEEEERCTTLDLKLIQVSTPSPIVTKKINQTILKAIFELDFGSEKYTTIDDLMNSVNLNDVDGGYDRTISSSFLMNINGILCLSIGHHYYAFYAAHPNGEGYYYNFNLQTGELISLDELLVPNFDSELNKIAEAYFIKEYGSDNWNFEVGEFELNRNFTITPGGLLFDFNRYEIGPYVMGVPSVFIPYSKINHLLKPNGLLEPWRKK